jgi:general secretion pathway protein G
MSNRSGFTLIELVVTVAIVSILASVAMPMLKVTVQRSKEAELKSNLRQIREAIDAYKKAYDEGRIELKNVEKSGYPPNLEVLVEGIEDKSVPDGKKKLRFLRRIPSDPMQARQESSSPEASRLDSIWGLRSYASESDNPTAGEDVYDIYSLSPHTGTNGIPYAKW